MQTRLSHARREDLPGVKGQGTGVPMLVCELHLRVTTTQMRGRAAVKPSAFSPKGLIQEKPWLKGTKSADKASSAWAQAGKICTERLPLLVVLLIPLICAVISVIYHSNGGGRRGGTRTGKDDRVNWSDSSFLIPVLTAGITAQGRISRTVK